MTDPHLLKDVSDEQLEAFVQIVVLVAYADGDLDPEEEKVLVSRVKELTSGRVSDEHLSELMIELPPLSRETSNWRATRIQSLRGKLDKQELRDAAFALAVDVARSNNGIGLREGRMLVNVVTELEIDPSFAQKALSGKA